MREPTGTMVEPTSHARQRALDSLLRRGPRQLELPLEGIPSTRTLQTRAAVREFTTGFAPRLGSQLLMRVGVPMAGAMSPVAIGTFAPHLQDDWRANLLVGSGLGGAWGAMVGATLPFSPVGERMPRLRAAGIGAATGIVMAPAVAAVSKYVVGWITSPLRDEPRAPAAGVRTAPG
jgi:hypothetical protein